MIRIPALDLQGRMLDVKLTVKLIRDASEQPIVRGQLVYDQMSAQRRLCGAHRPDVQVMDLHYARQSLKVLLYTRGIDAGRDGI